MKQSTLTAVATAALLSACPGTGSGPADAGAADADGGAPPAFVATTLFGTVLDDADGSPLSGVEVESLSRKATTGSDGTFVLEGLTVPSGRAALVARKAGWFATGKAAVPVPDGVTKFRLRLVKKVAQAVAATGGSVALSGGAGVQFQAASFQQGGAAFTDTVQVAARHLDPTAAGFVDQFPGDFAAEREDGSGSMLVSYGVVQVELEDEAGEKVELKPDAPATLTFPVPASLKGQAPATIPLWFFDEDDGLWKEEGSAALQGDQYVGEVQHFSAWNCDQPESTAYVTGAVTCGGKPVAGAPVGAGYSSGTTDEAGRFRLPVPANTVITVQVSDWNGVFASSVQRQAGPLAPGDTEDVGELPLDKCPARLKGRVVKQDGKPVSARVRVTWGADTGLDAGFAPGGTFGGAVPADTDVTIVVTTDGAETATVKRRTPASGGEDDLGDIVVAVVANCDFWDVAVNVYKIALSPDGSALAVAIYNGTAVELRDGATGAVEKTLTAGPGGTSFVEFSADGKRLTTASLFGGAPMVWDVETGALVQGFSAASVKASRLMADGSTLVAMTYQNKLAQYAVSDGSLAKALAFDLADPVDVMGFHGTEVLVLRAKAGAFSVTAWDMAADKEARSFDVGTTSVMGTMQEYALTGDGSVVAFQPRDSGTEGVFFWDVATGSKVAGPPFCAADCSVDAAHLSFRPDGSAFVTQAEESQGSSYFGPPTLYAYPGFAKMFTVPFLRYGRVDEYAWSGDGRFLAMAQHGEVVRVVDVSTCR